MKTEIAGVNPKACRMTRAGKRPRPSEKAASLFCRLILIFITLVMLGLRAFGAIFTTDAHIGPLDTSYDGQDIIISNCTVTVDGAHTFSSLTVATNGILTHSFSTNGQLSVAISVTNVSYILTGTTPDPLDNSNIFTPLIVAAKVEVQLGHHHVTVEN